MNGNVFDRRELFKKAAATSAGAGLLGLATGQGTAVAQDAPAASATPAAKVPMRPFGATGEKIPILVMGGSQDFDLKYEKKLHRAFEEGVTYIDTAEKYTNGNSHVAVGAFIEQVGRKNVWITSKSGLWGNAPECPPDKLLAAIEKEMPVLKTDYLDMYFMHGVRDIAMLDDPWIQMGQDMKKKGLTRFFGFSCHDGNVVDLMNKAAALGAGKIDGIMFRYSFAMYGNTELNKAIDACVKAGIGLIAMKTQASVLDDSEEVKRFQSDNYNLFQAKLKAVWADERISGAVSSMRNTDQIDQNVAAAKSPVQLSMKEWMQLNQFAARTANHRCNGCRENCESQIAGNTRVADSLRYLMYAECYGDFAEARQLYRSMGHDQRFDESIDYAAAAKACPQRIDIAARLRDAHTRLA